jgi:hypothetical protein
LQSKRKTHRARKLTAVPAARWERLFSDWCFVCASPFESSFERSASGLDSEDDSIARIRTERVVAQPSGDYRFEETDAWTSGRSAVIQLRCHLHRSRVALARSAYRRECQGDGKGASAHGRSFTPTILRELIPSDNNRPSRSGFQ